MKSIQKPIVIVGAGFAGMTFALNLKNLNPSLPILVVDSQTNFIFIKTGIDIKKFQPAMEKHKVLVGRPFPPYTNWGRLSIAKPEEMESFNKGFNKELG